MAENSSSSQPASTVTESEPNNSFATKQSLPSGISTVNGQLSSSDLDFFTISGLNSESLFTVEVNSDTFDPVLGLLDRSGDILSVSDDSANNSVIPILTGIVPTNGKLNLAVSGFMDKNLVGDHFQSGSYTLSLKSFTLPEPSVNPTIINGSFESSDFTGWTIIGSTSIQTSAFGSGPIERTSQALLSTAGATFSDKILETFLELKAGSLDNIGNGDVIQGSAIRQTFTANAGDILTFNWNFFTNEGAQVFPFNDFSFVSISSLSELVDVMFSSSVTSLTTQFFEETGFQTFSFTIPIGGTYTLGLGVVDVGDNTIDSGLLVDNVTLTSIPSTI
ncbi:hypothetical protein F7734_28585 [Scytonema sp. UIC 10036]|uniref:hypothetical protein n=1 Tax=Scytonema sp. UIC 10036 TaxID=2304196 RepID=UPI0012DA0533|nr:hypothetical protein [Scytonema sp. UIC 10036]MUG96085.1 hypothetical protein [Scytonema sp. UIC 10036]